MITNNVFSKQENEALRVTKEQYISSDAYK